MKRVVGIGGIFFKCKDPKALKEWYAKYLGFNVDNYGALFSFKNETSPETKGYLQWSPFDETTPYFAPSTKSFMINYRVHDLEKLIEVLKEEGIEFLDEMEVYDYGKFIHLLDPEGNKIELWEPSDNAFG